MLVKLYWSAWLAFVLVAMILLLTGNVSPMTLVVSGFVAFGLTFLGMINVLPSIVAHPAPLIEASLESRGASIETPVPSGGVIGVPSMRNSSHSPAQARAH